MKIDIYMNLPCFGWTSSPTSRFCSCNFLSLTLQIPTKKNVSLLPQRVVFRLPWNKQNKQKISTWKGWEGLPKGSCSKHHFVGAKFVSKCWTSKVQPHLSYIFWTPKKRDLDVQRDQFHCGPWAKLVEWVVVFSVSLTQIWGLTKSEINLDHWPTPPSPVQFCTAIGIHEVGIMITYTFEKSPVAIPTLKSQIKTQIKQTSPEIAPLCFPLGEKYQCPASSFSSWTSQLPKLGQLFQVGSTGVKSPVSSTQTKGDSSDAQGHGTHSIPIPFRYL